jgi:S-adenosylmethionine hydrolase
MNSPLTRPIITLTTDFGLASSYVAQMKGVILSRNPDVCLVDISHSIPPQDIRGGAIVLADACLRFPARTIHVAVVDPGVGTDRKIVFAQIGVQRFLAPNNGLLSLVAERMAPSQVIEVTNPLYFVPAISPTFHGRDILAPVAAHLSLGLNPKRLGDPLESLEMLPFPRPAVQPGQIAGQVIQIDSFGNLITNITSDECAAVPTPELATVQCKSAQTTGLVHTYGSRPRGSLVAVVGSSGRLELAIVQGNAAATLAATLDEQVIVKW